MWKKIGAYINKDVINENEVKMYAVIMRILLIITSIYNLLCFVSALYFGMIALAILSIVLLAVSGLMFQLTYTNHTSVATFVTLMMYLVIITLHSYMLGLNNAVSQLIFVVIMIICAIDYLKRIRYKIAAVITVLTYRIVLFTVLQKFKPYYEVSEGANSHWQTINMVAFSAMIVAITIISTADFSQMRSKLTQTNLKLRDVAGKDPLTGLFNRRNAIEYINGKIDGYKDGLYTSLTIAMADIDHFKMINDTYGHDKGDEVLVALADIMGKFMRDKGLASRWGGEEFVLIFVDINGDEAYGHLINLQKLIASKKFHFNGDEISITLTYGISEQSPEASLTDTLKEADEKLYIGKEKGRNIIIF